MKEIGGYFDFELKFYGEEFHQNAVRLNLARNALTYLVETKGYQLIYVPYFLCGCIADLMKKHSLDIEYYHVDELCRPVFNKRPGCQEAVWIVNYYGQLTENEIISYKNLWNHIILDNTQDFFSSVIDGVDTIYNARKYFGIADGGYLYTDILLDRVLEKGYSYDRMRHLVGRFEKTGNDFYSDFLQAEEALDHEELKQMSAFSRNILKGINYDMVHKIRRMNFKYLDQKLSHLNKWKLTKTGTYMYPFWSSRGSEIRKRLLESRIYIPTLWPNVVREMPEDTVEHQMAVNILPIPIDQRYSEKDMEFICNKILDIYES